MLLCSKSWFEDGLTEDEAEAAELLGLLSYEGGSASQLLVDAIFGEP